MYICKKFAQVQSKNRKKYGNRLIKIIISYSLRNLHKMQNVNEIDIYEKYIIYNILILRITLSICK